LTVARSLLSMDSRREIAPRPQFCSAGSRIASDRRDEIQL
jgi:hypothetical protein